MPQYNIKHITRYTYPSDVIDSANQIMLFPIHDAHQEVIKHAITISHKPHVDVFKDYFGNQVGIFSLVKPHNELTILSEIEVITNEAALPEDKEPPQQAWQELELLVTQLPYMDFVLQENSEVASEIAATVASLKDENDSPFS